MNQDAVLRVLLEERPSLTAFAWSILRDYHAAEDIYQDTIIRATHHTGEFDSRDHLLNWSRKVARNLAVDRARRADARTLILDNDVLDRLEQTATETSGTTPDALRAALADCLDQLTDRARRMIEYRYNEGKSVAQIAAIFQRKPESIYQAFYRTHQKLAECIQQRLGFDRPSP